METYFYKEIDNIDPAFLARGERIKQFLMNDLAIRGDVKLKFVARDFETPYNQRKKLMMLEKAIETTQEISGQYHGSKKTIFVDATQPEKELVKTIAHELIHVKQDRAGLLSVGSDSGQNDWAESQARKYESEALKKWEASLHKQSDIIDSLVRMAEILLDLKKAGFFAKR